MTSPEQQASSPSATEIPWYDLLPDPELPEDSMQQEDTIVQVMSMLKARYEDDPTVLCVAVTDIIYDSNVRGSVVAPDGFIVFGVEDSKHIRQIRNSYRIDEWGQTPGFALEVASESTAPRDLGPKRELYARIGIQEYWRLDRRGDIYGEHVVGERLVDGQYQRYDVHTDPNGDLWSRSQLLDLDFVYRVPDDGWGQFLLRDAATGEWLNNLYGERAARLEEAAARQAAEAKVAELQAELDQLRRQQH